MASPSTMTTSQEMRALQRTLIHASHILHQQGILDAYGHISVLHPSHPSQYIMSRSLAPALVSSPSDLITYDVHTNAALCDGNGNTIDLSKGFQERYIHGEIYKRFPLAGCVVHSHNEDVLAFAVNEQDGAGGGAGERLRAVFHVASFLGHGVPVFDIETAYLPADRHDMLVSSPHLGSALAACFAQPTSHGTEPLAHKVVLMANHGFTAVGDNIEQAVFRAVYTAVNARVQSKAILMNASTGGTLRVWSDEMVTGGTAMGVQTQGRPWELWVRECEVNPLYRNSA